MAEAGAHLTSTHDAERPSVFELLAQETLLEALRPALQHAAQVLAEAEPRCSVLSWRFDELFLFLDFLLQSHFLSVSAASFSENFYGLKRVSSSASSLPEGRGLNRKSRLRSLMLLCLVPYVRAKSERTWARQRDEDDFSIRPPRSGAVATLPYIGAAWWAWRLAQLLLFVSGRCLSHSPLLSLAGVRLERLSDRDLRELQGHTIGNPTSILGRLGGVVLGGVAVSLSTCLSFGGFFLQFLDWWYSSDNQSTMKALTSLPAPPPPLHLHLCPSGPALPSGQCPLCCGVRTAHTVLSTSGFVFCYRCIYVHVKLHQRCPLSGLPSRLQHLVRLYEG